MKTFSTCLPYKNRIKLPYSSKCRVQNFFSFLWQLVCYIIVSLCYVNTIGSRLVKQNEEDPVSIRAAFSSQGLHQLQETLLVSDVKLVPFMSPKLVSRKTKRIQLFIRAQYYHLVGLICTFYAKINNKYQREEKYLTQIKNYQIS